MTVVADISTERKRVISLLRDFCIDITKDLRNEINSTNDPIKLERIRRREIDKRLNFK